MALCTWWEHFGVEGGDDDVPNLAGGPCRAAWTLALCEQGQLSGFALLLLLLEVMDKQGKADAEIESVFFASSC